MNLILQGVSPATATVERIAALASPANIVSINDRAWRCEGVDSTSSVRDAIEAACQAEQLDYAFIAAGKKLADYKLVAMDMDSTLITIECIDEIADMQGLKPQVAEITEAAMRGELDFNESLTRRVALLKGLDAQALQRVYDERLQLSPGAETMLQAVQAAGLKTLLVSGGFTFFTDRMKTRCKIDYAHSNALDIVDGKLTGKVIGNIVNAEEKRLTLLRVCETLGIDPSQTITMGDGANDLRMMSASGLSVAFHAKPAVRRAAAVALNFVGLDGILNVLA